MMKWYRLIRLTNYLSQQKVMFKELLKHHQEIFSDFVNNIMVSIPVKYRFFLRHVKPYIVPLMYLPWHCSRQMMKSGLSHNLVIAALVNSGPRPKHILHT